jgi:hypothetical protein
VTRQIEIAFPGRGVVGLVELLDDEAPRTCQAIWDALPQSGLGSHAMFSGHCGALFLDDDTIGAAIGPENATTNIQTGDVMFTHYDAGERHGHLNALSEIYWAYDRYVRPVVPGRHDSAVANVFGRVVGDPAAFHDMSRRLASQGYMRIEIRRAG